MNQFKCHFCNECNGKACYGQMPGMGCPEGNKNFRRNVKAWKNIRLPDYADPKELKPATIMLAPMTGAVQNCGYWDERQFYMDMIEACCNAGVKISIGDGTPDEKLKFGIEAVKEQQKCNPSIKAAVIIKPYPNMKFLERMDWAQDVAESYGIDIDSYNIATMRDLVHLEKKTASQLAELKNRSNSLGLPFVVKGVFTKEDVEMVKELKPDVVYISNHGGRVDRPQGSTADFLVAHSTELKSCCGQLWVDGGIRSRHDAICAAWLGARVAGIGRPFVTALCRDGKQAVQELIKKFN